MISASRRVSSPRVENGGAASHAGRGGGGGRPSAVPATRIGAPASGGIDDVCSTHDRQVRPVDAPRRPAWNKVSAANHVDARAAAEQCARRLRLGHALPARSDRAADGRCALPHGRHHLLLARRHEAPQGVQRAARRAAAPSQDRDRGEPRPEARAARAFRLARAAHLGALPRELGRDAVWAALLGLAILASAEAQVVQHRIPVLGGAAEAHVEVAFPPKPAATIASRDHPARPPASRRYVPNDVDVLLTHGSAASPNGELLRIAISRISPWLHAHGHDHELHGATLEWDRRSTRPTRPPSKRRQLSDGSEGQGEQATRVDGSRIRPRLVTVNAAICNKRYEPVQLPVVVDLPKAPSRRLVHRGSTRAASASKSRRVPMRPGGRGNSTSATSAPHARGRGSAVRGGKGGAGAGGQAARRPAAEPVLSERGRGRTTQAQMGGSRMPNAAERRERRGAASRARNQSPGEAEE